MYFNLKIWVRRKETPFNYANFKRFYFSCRKKLASFEFQSIIYMEARTVTTADSLPHFKSITVESSISYLEIYKIYDLKEPRCDNDQVRLIINEQSFIKVILIITTRVRILSF